jgi:TonB-linked SusC/RagA family outer membrane protein
VVIEGKEVVGNVNYKRNIESTLGELLNPAGLKFKKINKRTYSILPNPSLRDGSKPVDNTHSTAEQFDDADVTSGSDNLLSGSFLMQVQQMIVSGKVTDDQGAPIPGANILIKGTTIGTSTDSDGKFSISVPDADAVLVVSFIGFISKEVVVGNQTEINISLTSDIRQLSEVVVVGYGTQKKTSVTGAISSVSAEEISAQPAVVNVGQALQGRVAGVTVTNNGAPGSAPIVRIRGIGTVNNADPLYVVDGFPTGDMNSFNPKDIQSIEVLKDAMATAIYGSRAANGVIMITTKRGSNNKKISVTVDSYYGVEKAWRTLDLMNTDQYIDFATELLTNADIYKQETKGINDPDVVIGSGVPARIRLGGLDQAINSQTTQTFRQTNTDWQDEMFRTGRVQQHKVELSGGSEASRMFASAGYFEQEGIMLGTGYKRGDARFNSDHKISKRITFGQNFYVAYDERLIEQQAGGRTQVQHMIRQSPYFPVYNPDNFGGFFGAQSVDGSDPENPVRIAMQDKQNQQRLKLFANGYVDVKILDFLTYRFQGGVDFSNFIQRQHLPAYSTGGYSNRPEAQINQNRSGNVNAILTNQLTFNKAFGKHNINATVIAEQTTNTFSQITGQGNNPQSNDIQEPVALSAISFSGSKSEWALLSYLGRINYEFANKYLIGASFRRDGSSRFGPGNKWGSFPAFSAGWRLSEESFLLDNNFISELKLRGSYGAAGNNSTSNDYPFQSTISGNQIYEFDRASAVSSAGYTIRTLNNANISWETTYMTNIGLDLGILNNQVTLTAEYFRNKTTDMIQVVNIPNSFGYDGRPNANVGDVENKGFELELGYEKAEGALTFNASANMSVIRNKVLNLGTEGNSLVGGNWYGDDITNTKVGEPIAYFNGYVTDGLFQAGDDFSMQPEARPGDIRFRDLTGDGAITAADKQKVGHFLPDFSYGVNFSANWKGFDAQLFLQGVQGNDVWSIVQYDLEGMSRLFNGGADLLNRWTPENTNTDIPRAVSGDPNRNSRASDRFVSDGSYMRIKNLTIGYNVPVSGLASILNNSVSKLRIYVTSQNLLTLTKYDEGYDPEIGNRNAGNNGLTQGIDFGQYPSARSVVVGVQVGF